MANKKMNLVGTDVGGIDLMIERDSGNMVRILTGSQKYSIEVWRELHDLCEQAIAQLKEVG